MGVSMLNGAIQGSDSRLHVSYVYWLDQYFPNIPHWYPHQGGGESLLHGYPLLAHELVVVLHRLSELSILQAFRLISFLGFPLTALGIYLFCWSVLQNQTIGLIAAVFYLLAPVTWTWMYNWGFFAQQVAIVFLPISLIAFDRVIKYQLEQQHAGQKRLWFAALVLLVLFASLSHMLVGSAAAIGMTLYTIFSSLGALKGKRSAILRCGIRIVLMAGFSIGLLAAIYFVPFYAYGQVANREGLNTPPVHQLHRLPILEFFGINPIDLNEILTRIQFPLVVTIFAFVGILLCYIRSRSSLPEDKKTKAMALTLIVGTVFSLTPALAALVLRVSPLLLNFINFRSLLLLVMMLMPVTAGYGVWALTCILIYPERIRHLSSGQLRKETGDSRVSIRPALISIVSLLVAGFSIFHIGRSSYLPYGPLIKGLDLKDVWQRGGNHETSLMEQLIPGNWPPFILRDQDEKIAYSQKIASLLPEARPLRVDVSPYNGQLAMDMVTYADASQINSYTFQISLIHATWGYQQNVYYSRSLGVAEYGNPQTLCNNAKWFGTEYVFLNSDYDSVETYEAAGWVPEYREGNLELWHYPDAPGMATFATKPVVLIIGQPETDAYMTIFRLANDGMLPYDEAFLVEGQPRVDGYSIEELRSFDVVLLYGYDYKKGRKAWETLSAYVEGGGSLFVDTGWEFWIPEWEFEQAPEVLPVRRLTWTDYGMAEDYVLETSEIAGDIDVSRFKPLVWEGKPWTLSGAEMNDVKEWGRVVLSAEGKPLIIAGEYGKGRVVWSGMNIISHARYLGENEEELLLIHNILGFLTEQKGGIELADPVVIREHPDRVEFSVEPMPDDITWLYWREAYYPNWHAILLDNSGEREIPIYRAGPGFMLMPIEGASKNASIRLEWKTSLVERAALILTLLGAILLIAHVIDGLLLGGNGLTWVKLAFTVWLPKPILDEKAHEKVSEKGRSDLAVTINSQDRDRHAVSSSHSQKSLVGHGQPPRVDEGRSIDIEIPQDMLEAVEDESLLQSWLAEHHDQKDYWVERVLQRNRNRESGFSESQSQEETMGK